ncbi:MAG: MarR family transcriptional regulator [Firmicutes bacterium]|nr:MarR family transcriptional regulator [Bacillota bacterium]
MKKAKKLFESYRWVGEISNKTIIELKKTSDILEEVHNIFFNRFQISSTKFNVLVLLYTSEKEGLMLSELGKEMLVTKANITGLVDRLQKQGLVERKRHHLDRRKIMAVITEKGKKFTKRIMDDYKEWSKYVMTILDDNEKKQLVNLLQKLQTGLIEGELV